MDEKTTYIILWIFIFIEGLFVIVILTFILLLALKSPFIV
jgi:hypothetical protein